MSKYMLFNAGNKILYPFETKIDYIFERVFNFLGLIMDGHLNWKSHVEIFSNKCSKTIGVLNKLKYFLPLTVKIQELKCYYRFMHNTNVTSVSSTYSISSKFYYT